MKKVAILGPEYSYCHILAEKIFTNDELTFCNTIKDVFRKVADGSVDEGIVSFENMMHGAVSESILSLKKYNAKINKAFILPVSHCLASKTDNFSKVISHPQALSQCSDFLEVFRSKGYGVEDANSTSEAMKIASEDERYAAIGASVAAGHFGLSVIKKGIENNQDNVTSFVLISKNQNEYVEGDNVRTSMMVVPDRDKPGLLFEILSTFKLKNINLTKTVSIPSGKKIGEYLFFIEVDGNVNDEGVKSALDFLKTMHPVEVFGSYKVVNVVT